MQSRQCDLRIAAILAALLLASFAANARASTEKVLHEFKAYPEGAQPQAGVVADAAGNLYGTTWGNWCDGGCYDYGEVFELVLGSDGKYRPKVLHSFNGADGRSPRSGVTLDAAGNVWGTTSYGGAYGCGTVYELTPVRGYWRETTNYSFGDTNDDGCEPIGGLTFDKKGRIFGATTGWPTSNGTVFMLAKGTNGMWTETTIYKFGGWPDGRNPASALVIGQGGRIYGVTTGGGTNDLQGGCSNGCGTAFMLTPSRDPRTWSETVLYDFGASYSDAYLPWGSPVFDASGNLYGTALGGEDGTVFELSPSEGGQWTETILHWFTGSDGISPYAGVVFDTAGNLYGTASAGDAGYGTVYELSPGSGGWAETVVHSFTGSRDGGDPLGGVIIDASGRLYGTTTIGGDAGVGNVFRMTPSNKQWEETVLFGFPRVDGAYPLANVILGGLHNLYGTTSEGGNCPGYSGPGDFRWGCGTVFELTPGSGGRWTRKLLYQFRGTSNGASDGQGPAGGLVSDRAGNLYGTTETGGATGNGTVFELTPSPAGAWTEKIWYAFQGGQDGSGPLGPLILDASGNLYGTTAYGGGGNCSNLFFSGCGTVFELSPSGAGWTETVLYRFTGGSDGLYPEAGLVFDTVGNLYGTAFGGGSSGWGTVFMVSPGSGGWTETTIHSFTEQNGDGGWPECTLVFDSGASLYGTTEAGGANGRGTAFKLYPSGGGWAESVLYSFTGGSDGEYPAAGLVFDSAGSLYGTAACGANSYGSCGAGSIFKLSPSGDTWTESTLYDFTGGSDGANPLASLVLDSSGILYGTAYTTATEEGVVFSLTP